MRSALPPRRALLQSAIGLLACVAFCAWSQEVVRVYPRYVVNGQEASFTVEGRQFPTKDPDNLGMKHTFAKPAECTQPRRTRPATASRYYFSCRFASNADSARLTILHKTKVKTAIRLWEGSLQVLPAPPEVRGLALVAEAQDGNSHIECDASQRCITVVGRPVAGQALQIEVLGSNLPVSLHVELAACAGGVSTLRQSLDTHVLNCKSPGAGEHPIVVLTAPRNEGGTELMGSRLSLAPAAGAP